MVVGVAGIDCDFENGFIDATRDPTELEQPPVDPMQPTITETANAAES